jgi:hypothetical protein
MEKQQGKAGNLAKQLIHIGAVILDMNPVTYRSPNPEGFIITANLDFAEWLLVFGDSRMITHYSSLLYFRNE